MSKKDFKKKLQNLRTELLYGNYIHGVDLNTSVQKIADDLLYTKRLNTLYIYDLSGIVGVYWKPKNKYLSNADIETEDDVFTFITGMNKETYLKKLNGDDTPSKRPSR